jgi:thiamine biosynthesis lipoprotein
MATSGDYRNFFESNSQRKSHTIDPRSGQPIAHGLASVTVLHPQCALADAYATALNVMGPEQGLALAEELQLPVLMLVRDGEGLTELRSSHFPELQPSGDTPVKGPQAQAP